MSKGGNRAGVQGWVAEGPWPLWTKGVPCDVGSGAPVGGGVGHSSGHREKTQPAENFRHFRSHSVYPKFQLSVHLFPLSPRESQPMLWVRGDLRAQLVCGGGDGGPIHENQRQPGGPLARRKYLWGHGGRCI